MRPLIVVSLLISLSSCCATPPHIILPIPPRPTYPTLTSEQDAQFFTQLPGIYQIVGRREKTCQADAERVRDLLRAYNNDN